MELYIIVVFFFKPRKNICEHFRAGCRPSIAQFTAKFACKNISEQNAALASNTLLTKNDFFGFYNIHSGAAAYQTRFRHLKYLI